MTSTSASCPIRSLSAHTVPHIHAAHIIFTIITQTIATELAFHSSKIVQWHATLASNGSITESDNPSKTRPIWAKTLSIYSRLQYPWSATSLSFDNYISNQTFLSSVSLFLTSPSSCMIALAWLATGAAERLQLTNNAPPLHHWLFLTMHLPLLLCSRSSWTFYDSLAEFPPSRNSSIAPFFRLTKPPHPPSFQTDNFHNCSSIPSHNSAPPIGLHAHLVAAVTQASLHSISHAHPAELPMQW
jgi:hypothetical protein